MEPALSDTIREVHTMVRDMQTALAVQGEVLRSISSASIGTEAATLRLADIAEERLRVDAEDRDAKREADKAAIVASREWREMVTRWFGDNWKWLGIAGLMMFNPASLKQLSDMGLLGGHATPAPVAVMAPAPLPVSAPIAMPRPVPLARPVVETESTP